jgi:glycosyltransferase involved in cell wall biosynthesis
MKIARIFVGDVNNQKGKFNNVIERIKHLNIIDEFKSDNYLIQYRYSTSFKLLKPIKNKITKTKYTDIDNVKLTNIFVKISLLDYLMVHVFKLKALECNKSLNNFIPLFENYDIITTHDLPSSFLAFKINKRYNIPFTITWHGSDINKYPFRSKKTYSLIRLLLNNSFHNFFVSRALQSASELICNSKNKSVLYSGPADRFYKKNDCDIQKLKIKLGVKTDKVIGFIGNLEPIKNVLSLPKIFEIIQKNSISQVSFLIIGDGKLEKHLKKNVDILNIQNVFFIGKLFPEVIPNYLNIFDILILPSINEGMPRVILEAQACGVQTLASNVGGISEVISEEYIFPLNQDFESNIANKAIDLLKKNHTKVQLDEKFSWKNTISNEAKIYKLATKY